MNGKSNQSRCCHEFYERSKCCIAKALKRKINESGKKVNGPAFFLQNAEGKFLEGSAYFLIIVENQRSC